MSCYSLKGLLGVPGGSYRILTTLKGIWRILEVEEFLSGPYMSFKVLEGRGFQEGTKRVSGGSDGSENVESLLEYDIMT